MSQLDNVIITDIEVIQKTEKEWSKDNPVVGLGYGAYSIDTHLMRKGDGSSKWSELESFYPSTYVGPHAHTHEVGGNDEIKLTNSQLPHTANGTVVFGTGTGTTDIPLSGFTLTEAYVCENETEVNQIKEIASNQENIFNNWIRYSHATLGEHTDGSYTFIVTDEDNAYPVELERWSYNSSLRRISNTSNSVTAIGMVSPEKYTDYELEATIIVDPDDFDDDTMGLVLAYVNDSEGKNHTLSVHRSIGGNIPYSLWHNYGKTNSFEILRNTKTVKWGTGFYGNTNTEAKYWTSSGGSVDSMTRRLRHYLFRKGVKINISRKGNVFTILTSNFANDNGYVVAEKYMYPNTTEQLYDVRFECASEPDLLEETKMVLDLDNNTISDYVVTYNADKTAIISKTWRTTNLSAYRAEALAVYKQPVSIGYTCASQKNTTWNNIKFLSSNSKIYNISTNEVEEQQADGSWKVNTNTSIYEEIKPGRFAYNTYTNKLFYIQDGKVLSLSSSGSSGNAPIGSTYVQFSGCSDPTTLFGGTWSNISSTYPGMFFRAEGGSAATFGSNQNGGLPNIEGSTEQVAYTQMCSSAGALSITQIGNCSVSGSNHTFNRISINASLYNSLYGAANEVRPINSTIRIWIRTA